MIALRPLSLIVGGSSAALLGGALAFQYLGGLAPCVLCLWQRWPHGMAIGLAVVAFAVGVPGTGWRRPFAVVFVALFLISTGLGLYHVGIEQGWIAGPASCSAPIGQARSVEDLQRMILARPVVRCDEVPWALAGVSLAGWNALASLALAGVALAAFRGPARSARRMMARP